MDSTAAIQKLFGQRVKYFREQRGWGLEKLGAGIQKSKATISRLENGKQNLSMVDIAQIAQVLEVDVVTLFRQEDSSALPSMDAANVRELALHHERLQDSLATALEETHALTPYIQTLLERAG